MISLSKNELLIKVSKFIAENSMPLADRSRANSALISRLGFKRIAAFKKCRELICAEAQIQESEDIDLEMAREVVTSYLKPPHPIHFPPNGYVSPLLGKLRRDRELRGHSFEWYKTSGLEEWRYELSPFEQEMSRLHKTDEFFEEYRNRFDEIISKARSEEISKFSTGALRSFATVSMQKPKKNLHQLNLLLKELLSPLLSKFGFDFSKKLSSGAHKLVFIWNNSPSLQLRIILVLDEWHCDWRLFCCKPSLGTRFDGVLGEWYSGETAHEIRLWKIIPYFRYRDYCSSDDLEVCTRAHVASLELELEFLRNLIARADEVV